VLNCQYTTHKILSSISQLRVPPIEAQEVDNIFKVLLGSLLCFVGDDMKSDRVTNKEPVKPALSEAKFDCEIRIEFMV